MKDLNEVTERMDNMEEIVENLVKKTSDLQKREVKFPEISIPDYSSKLEDIKQQIKDSQPDYGKRLDELTTLIKQQHLDYPAEKIQAHIEEYKDAIRRMPTEMPIRHHHYLDVKTNWFLIAGMLSLMVTAITSGYCFYLSSQNNKLKANDIKFRMIKQAYPVQAKWADTYYTNSPDSMAKQTELMEEEAKERSEATDIADQKEREAKEARQKLIKLKKHR